MRIAMISSTDAYWTPLYALHFLAEGHDVRVLSMTPEPLADSRIDLVTICSARPARVPLATWFLAQVPAVRRALRSYAPDVVFATYMSSNGTVAALAWNGPLVVSGHGGDVLQQLGRVPGGPWLHRQLMRFQSRRSHAVHVVADELVESLTAYGIPSDQIICFPLGVEVERFALANHAPRDAVPHIVCTRRQEPVYANHVLVEALAILRDRGHAFRCTFVGGGPLLDERRTQVRTHGLEGCVAFTGKIDADQVGALLRTAHIYVSASTTDGTSSSLLEAMLCGAFPVVSRIRGNAPWVEDGITGLLFDVGDAGALAAALERAVRHPELREASIAHNRALVEQHGNLRLNMLRTLELLEGAATRRTRPCAQGRISSSSTSKYGAVGSGAILPHPGTALGALARIGRSTAAPE